MTFKARSVYGVEAVEVFVSEGGREARAIVMREAVQERWRVGYGQDGLLQAVQEHSEAIVCEMHRQAAAGLKPIFVIRSLPA